MDAKDFAKRLVESLRKRSAEYKKMKYSDQGEWAINQASSNSLSETADCIEEALATFDEE